MKTDFQTLQEMQGVRATKPRTIRVDGPKIPIQ